MKKQKNTEQMRKMKSYIPRTFSSRWSSFTWLILFAIFTWGSAQTVSARPHKRRSKKSKLRLGKRYKRSKRSKRLAQSPPDGGKKGKKIFTSPKCRVNWGIRVRPDFKKAAILTVVKWIAKHTCKNFIISDRIRGGTLHIISEKSVTLRNALRAFYAALEANQMTTIRVGRFLKIIYARDARKSPTRTYTRGRFRHPNRDEVVTYLYRLKHVDARAMSNLARQLITSTGGVVPYQPSRVLLITDYASNLYRVLRILRTLDVADPESKAQVYVLQIKYAQAREIVQKVRQLFEVGRRRKSKRRRRTLRIRPARRIVRKSPKKLSRKKRPKATEENSEDAYRIKKLVSDERTNQLIVLCNPIALKRLSKLIKDLDVPLAGEGQIWVYYLKFATANELAQTLSQITRGSKKKRRRRRGPKKASEMFEGQVKVTADKATNALVVVASRRDYESLIRVVEKLDVPRKQVFVEIVILEVSINKSRELGLTFHKAENVTGDTSKPTLGLLGTRLAGLNSLVLDPSALLGLAFGLRGSEVPGTSGLLGANSGALPSFGVLLRAIQSNTNVDIISTPHILTTANKEATLQVGQNVPFISGTSVGGGLGAAAGIGSFQNIKRQDVALTIKLKPQVDSGNYVRLDFQQELTELAGQDPELGPTTTKRKIKTVILARDRQTVVIGGLVREKVTNGVSKVPILGDIPLIGALFRLKKRTTEKRNLLVFLTPYIIRSQNDFKEIFKQKLKERQEFIKLFYAGKGRKLPEQLNYNRTPGMLETVRRNIERGKKEAVRMKKEKLRSAKEEQEAKRKPQKTKQPAPLPSTSKRPTKKNAKQAKTKQAIPRKLKKISRKVSYKAKKRR